MNNLQSLIVGIISGIVTSALIYLAVVIFRKIIIPWYQEIVYQGVSIAGEWRLASESAAQAIVLNLSQHAYRLAGTATVINRREAPHQIDLIRVFKVQGTISNRFVMLNMKLEDTNRIGLGTGLLEVIGDGQRMIGAWTFYEVMQGKIFSANCTLNRASVNGSNMSGAEPTGEI